MDRDKYRRLFIDEARENLAQYTNHLVEFEKQESAGGEAAEKKRAEALDACFRAAHSLKGMAASMGYDAFAELAHTLEDLADKGRQGRRLGAEAVDLLLEGGDRLEAMVELIAAGREDALEGGDLAERIRALLATTQPETTDLPSPAPSPSNAGPKAAPAPAPQTAGHASELTAHEGPSGGLVVSVRFAEGTPLPQARAFMLHRALSALEGYQATSPEPDALKRELPADHTVRFHFAASADGEAIRARALEEQGVAEVVVSRAGAAVEKKEAPSEVESARGADEDRTVRVRTALLDELIDSVGELLLTRSRLRALATRWEAPELDDLVDEVERLTRELHDRVVAARMTPLTFVTDRLPRVLRDLSRHTHKKVELSIDVGEIELDRAILDDLFTPLLHMVRNAVDHGHEGSETRLALGKPEAMSLRLRASRDRDRVVLELSDDGGGIDVDAVRARAVERGLLDPHEARELPDARVVEMICAPGFSTAEVVTETSGRGVGMDVVRATLERLGGTLRIHSERGEGTTFVLMLPLTVAIIRVLVVEAGDEQGRSVFAIPIARVEKALDLNERLVTYAQGRAHLVLDEQLLPLFDLGEQLGFPPAGGARGTAILVERGEDTVAFRVAAVVGQEEVVIKPLGRPLSALGWLAGATLLADGRVAYILEPNTLAPEARAISTRAAPGATIDPAIR